MSITGCDLMIHEVFDTAAARSVRLFDPDTRRDISEAFPSVPAVCVYNRSRTACLTLSEGQAVVYDILSARSGPPKVTPRPAWTSLWFRAQAIGREQRLILTENAQHLVLAPLDDISKDEPASAPRTNLKVEAYSATGDKEVWLIPPARSKKSVLNTDLRRAETIVDAEWVDGKILLFSTHEISPANALQGTEMKVLNMQGETLHEGKIDGWDVVAQWDPARHEAVGLPKDFPLTAPGTELQVWNYDSSTVQNITLRR